MAPTPRSRSRRIDPADEIETEQAEQRGRERRGHEADEVGAEAPAGAPAGTRPCDGGHAWTPDPGSRRTRRRTASTAATTVAEDRRRVRSSTATCAAQRRRAALTPPARVRPRSRSAQVRVLERRLERGAASAAARRRSRRRARARRRRAARAPETWTRALQRSGGVGGTTVRRTRGPGARRSSSSGVATATQPPLPQDARSRRRSTRRPRRCASRG